jgi:hypothetical protein
VSWKTIITTYSSYAGIRIGMNVIRSKAYYLRDKVKVLISELGKPLIPSRLKCLKRWYIKTIIWKYHIEFRVEDRSKSECRSLIDLIEPNGLIREDADLNKMWSA